MWIIRNIANFFNKEDVPVAYGVYDRNHAEIMARDFSTFEEALGECERLASIPWNTEPNNAPTGAWRDYVIIQYRGINRKWLQEIPVVEITSKWIVWHIGMSERPIDENFDGFVWSIAVSKNESENRAIIFRYVSRFPKSFERKKLSDRIIIAWEYEWANWMPTTEEAEDMGLLDIALDRITDNDFSTMALSSTGEGLKEWICYAKSEDEFIEKLNESINQVEPLRKNKKAFPIMIHTAKDPEWKNYEDFITGMKF